MIVVLGSTNTDMVVSGAKIPVPGETVCGGSFMMNPGGKGANQAVAVNRLSAQKGAPPCRENLSGPRHERTFLYFKYHRRNHVRSGSSCSCQKI